MTHEGSEGFISCLLVGGFDIVFFADGSLQSSWASQVEVLLVLVLLVLDLLVLVILVLVLLVLVLLDLAALLK